MTRAPWIRSSVPLVFVPRSVRFVVHDLAAVGQSHRCPCSRCCRCCLWGLSRLHSFDGLRLRFLVLVFSTNLNGTLQYRSVFHTDAWGDYVAGKRAFAADVQTIGAMDVAGHRAHNDHFLGTDIGNNDAATSDGYAAVGKIDGALDAAIDI